MKLSFSDFLSQKDQFQLGDLTTEQFNPDTIDLASLAKKSPDKALRLLLKCDEKALKKYQNLKSNLASLKQAMSHHQGRVFLVGCGATGRIVLHLEKFARMQGLTHIFSFMAGGDAALIKSIELVEDHANLGKKHLEEFSPTDQDMVIGVTEGGETSYVIGAVNHASAIGAKSFIIYCNDDEQIYSTCHRCAEFIDNPKIENISLNVGPMALAGSTRMQASTVLHLALAHILFDTDESALIKKISSFNCSGLSELAKSEAKFFHEGASVIYQASPNYGLTVLTDTTERAPTFGLNPFENINEESPVESFNHLEITSFPDNQQAWGELLSRDPRGLNWPELSNLSCLETIDGFSIYDGHAKSRLRASKYFGISKQDDAITFSLGNNGFSFDVSGLDYMQECLLLKMVLNAYSTTLMGILGRYESNVMTWVRSSNYKLIDRTIRYTRLLLSQEKIEVGYETVAKAIFESSVEEGESMVEKLVRRFKSQN